MTQVSMKRALLAAAAFTLFPAAALAQEDVKERAAELSEQANEMQRQAQELANDATPRDTDRDDRADGVGAVTGDRVEGREGGANGERDGDGDSGKWGLLGLLGLAGLLGLKRRDNHVHPTDNRRV